MNGWWECVVGKFVENEGPLQVQPWTLGPLVDDELTLEWIKFSVHVSLQVPAHQFRMVRTDTGQIAGRINLRVTSNSDLLFYAGHIGYGVDQMYRGRRFAARSLRLLIPLARELALDPLWITCNPENIPSRRSCELAGAEFVEIVAVPEDTDTYREGIRQKCRYRLDLASASANVFSSSFAMARRSAPQEGKRN
jgi:predicted acetyltransferase